MPQLPILHSQRAAYDWMDQLQRMRSAYESAVEADPSRLERDRRWLDTSLVLHALRIKGLPISREEVDLGTSAHVAGALAALARVREIAEASGDLTPDLLGQVNGFLDPANGGRLRDGPPVAAYRGHTSPGPEALPRLLQNAADWFTAQSFSADFHPVEQAAIALVRICDLQPFASNNELTARIAVSLFTIRAGWLPVVVHEELEQEYREALLHALHMDTRLIVELVAKCLVLSYGEIGVT